MTPQEKAKHILMLLDGDIILALIGVDEKIDFCRSTDGNQNLVQYWEEVRKEIINP